MEERKQFIFQAIPELKMRSRRVVEKVINAFQEETFVQDFNIYKEGHKNSKCYIIRSGECRIIKNQDPNLVNLIHKNRATKKYLENKSGYFSKTTNTFQIGIIEKG